LRCRAGTDDGGERDRLSCQAGLLEPPPETEPCARSSRFWGIGGSGLSASLVAIVMDETSGESSLSRARADTVAFVRERPILNVFLFLIPAAATGILAALASTEDWDEGWRVALVVGATIGGALLVLAVIFLIQLITAPRHQLEDRVADLEEQSDDQREQIANLTQEQRGERDQFVPTYIDLRAAVRQARGYVAKAIETGRLWDRTVSFSTATWDKNKSELAKHPYAKAAGVVGPCADAFEHVDNLSSIGIMRFRSSSRVVQPQDNLDTILAALDEADRSLTAAIGEAQPAPPQQSHSPPNGD